MKKIIKTSGELSFQQLYNLTSGNGAEKLSAHAGEEIPLDVWAIFEDVSGKTGELYEVAAFEVDGVVIATNSPTFVDTFKNILEMAKEVGANVDKVRISSGTAKSGRTFYYCEPC